ncbi:hypothetical protein BKA67DRAFT_403610 [Truncatella angustata]|uniref:Uncharacterized protein n=1 Tax=Truncatella angustata TaxID=152316 RepID=A0A9P8ZTZ2_9PEZI|nr:uncharacterized protein BKA67DRAFT_403610 [Truncatella angustata]KAH6648003.1 hypothetical protein BKA67DRAFT_403610 [Truncatella angustata]
MATPLSSLARARVGALQARAPAFGSSSAAQQNVLKAAVATCTHLRGVHSLETMRCFCNIVQIRLLLFFPPQLILLLD